jgi:hypothetical protein
MWRYDNTSQETDWHEIQPNVKDHRAGEPPAAKQDNPNRHLFAHPGQIYDGISACEHPPNATITGPE